MKDLYQQIIIMEDKRNQFKKIITKTDERTGLMLIDVVENLADSGKRGIFLEGGNGVYNVKLGKGTALKYLDNCYTTIMEYLNILDISELIDSKKVEVKKNCTKNNHFDLTKWNNDITEMAFKNDKVNNNNKRMVLYLCGYIQATSYKRKLDAIINKMNKLKLK